MLKTPPRLAALGIALTILAIGTGNVLDANQIVEVPDFLIEELQPFLSADFQPNLQGHEVDFEITIAPNGVKLQKAC